MYLTYQPAQHGRAFLPIVTDGHAFDTDAVSFQVPVNLSADEIRDMVRDLLG